MPDTTTTTQVDAVNAHYDRALLARARPANIHGLFAQVKKIPKKHSSTIKFRRYASLAVATTALTEGTPPAGKQLSKTDLTATILQYGDYTKITDVVQLTVEDDVLNETSILLGEQAGETIDVLTRDVLAAGTNVIYSNGTARNQVNTDLTAADLKMVIRALKRQNTKFLTKGINANTGVGTTPIRAGFVMFVHPDTTAVLEGIAGFKPVSEYPKPDVALEHEVGSFKELRFIESTNAKVFADAGATAGTMISTTGTVADVYASVAVGLHAYGTVRLDNKTIEMIIKALGSAGTADPLDQLASMGWKAWHVAKILNDAFMIRLEHGNTDTLT